ncbi:DUF4097 family beta strand repeat-containing protein [uncultured Vagococcus sp.]|uniref:DUF4097 family beta strand repeat-containing protein n=1 Tax=uncultured Vagococcus sp. TaxID=189676 RepID=UPI0028D4DB50|nr:DUF4097 family beta strand repeat-containing protein [uncultured Vagococcus sp.]
MKKTICGIILLGSLAVFAGGCGVNKAKLVNTQELSTSGLKEISINYHSDSVNFYESDSDKVRVEEYLLTNKENAKADIKDEDKRLSITGGKRTSSWFTLNDNSHIDIYLPKDYHEMLGINVTSGSVRASESFELKEFSGKANSGSLKLKSVKADKIKLKSTSGSVKVTKLIGDETELKSNSGSIKIDEIISQSIVGEATSGSLKIAKVKGDLKLTANSGDIKVGEAIGSAKLKTTSGSVTASFNKVSGDISAEANSGSIKLTIPKDLQFAFNSKTSSGSISTDFNDDLSKDGNHKTGTIGTDPEVTIATKATSGSIKVIRN